MAASGRRFVMRSARFVVVCSFTTTILFARTASCTQRCFSSKCLTLPRPCRAAIPLAALASDPTRGAANSRSSSSATAESPSTSTDPFRSA